MSLNEHSESFNESQKSPVRYRMSFAKFWGSLLDKAGTTGGVHTHSGDFDFQSEDFGTQSKSWNSWLRKVGNIYEELFSMYLPPLLYFKNIFFAPALLIDWWRVWRKAARFLKTKASNQKPSSVLPENLNLQTSSCRLCSIWELCFSKSANRKLLPLSLMCYCAGNAG